MLSEAEARQEYSRALWRSRCSTLPEYMRRESERYAATLYGVIQAYVRERANRARPVNFRPPPLLGVHEHHDRRRNHDDSDRGAH